MERTSLSTNVIPAKVGNQVRANKHSHSIEAERLRHQRKWKRIWGLFHLRLVRSSTSGAGMAPVESGEAEGVRSSGGLIIAQCEAR